MLVRARSVLITPGVARLDCVAQSPSAVALLLFRSGLFLLLFFLLVTGFPAVGNLGQELADSLDVGDCPEMNGHAATRGSPWWRYLPRRDVPAQSRVC